jgi:hypothetical protein
MDCGHLVIDKFGRCENCFVLIGDIANSAPEPPEPPAWPERINLQLDKPKNTVTRAKIRKKRKRAARFVPNGVFTRRAASVRSMVLCMPGASMKPGGK